MKQNVGVRALACLDYLKTGVSLHSNLCSFTQESLAPVVAG